MNTVDWRIGDTVSLTGVIAEIPKYFDMPFIIKVGEYTDESGEKQYETVLKRKASELTFVSRTFKVGDTVVPRDGTNNSIYKVVGVHDNEVWCKNIHSLQNRIFTTTDLVPYQCLGEK